MEFGQFSSQIPEIGSTLTEYHYERIFKIYSKGDKRFYNILRSLKLPSLPDRYFFTYDVGAGDTYPFISYKVYGTIYLWWLICYANNILDPTKLPKEGKPLKILRNEVVQAILQDINTYIKENTILSDVK